MIRSWPEFRLANTSTGHTWRHCKTATTYRMTTSSFHISATFVVSRLIQLAKKIRFTLTEVVAYLKQSRWTWWYDSSTEKIGASPVIHLPGYMLTSVHRLQMSSRRFAGTIHNCQWNVHLYSVLFSIWNKTCLNFCPQAVGIETDETDFAMVTESGNLRNKIRLFSKQD